MMSFETIETKMSAVYWLFFSFSLCIFKFVFGCSKTNERKLAVEKKKKEKKKSCPAKYGIC